MKCHRSLEPPSRWRSGVRNALVGTLTFDQLIFQLRHGVDAQAVLRVQPGRFLMIPAGSPRLAAIDQSEEWSACLVGVFSPDVGRDVLFSEVM